MRVLVLGDSLGLPRPHRINNYSPNEKELAVHYEHTYSSLIQQHLFNTYKAVEFYEVINRSKRFCTIRDIANEFSDYLFFYEPDVIILQVGIVDCWFREARQQIVNKQDFEKYLDSIITRLNLRPLCKLIIVGISPTSVKMDGKYPKINLEIKKYNKIYKEYVNHNNIFFINMESFVNVLDVHKYLLPDDHHLNREGNKLVAKEILKIIEGIIYTKRGTLNYETEEKINALNNFKTSYEMNPYLIDNLYNLLVLSFENNEKELCQNVITFCEEHILDHEITELINNIKLNL